MKNKKKLFNIFFIALLLFSCEKEKQIVKGKLPAKDNCTPNGQRIDPRDMEDAMNSFITLTNENHVADCPSYEAEDAMLIMEAALNYHTCTPDSDYYEIAADTLAYEMDLVRGETGEFMFSNENMNNLWPTILDDAMEAHNRVSFDSPNNPFNIVVDLEFTEFDRESQASTQTAVLQVITWVARGGGGNNVGCGYGTNDYWNPSGPPYGYGCGSNSSSTSSWALPAIQARLSPVCTQPCTGVYISNISYHTFTPYDPNFATCTQNACFTGGIGISYSALWFGAPSSLNCESPSDLGCETNETINLANCSTYKPTGTSVISYFMYLGMGAQSPYYMLHCCTVKYGICHDFGH